MKKKGFTLLETLAGLALTSLLAFVIFDLFGQAEKGRKGVYSAVDFNTLLLTIHSITTDEDYCREAFRNQNNTTAAKHSALAAPEQKLGAIYWTNRNHTPLNPLDGIRLAAVNENINKGLRIKSLDLRTLLSRLSAIPGKTIDIVELVVKAEKTSQANHLSSALLSNEATPFRFAIQRDSTDGTIEECLLEPQSTPLLPIVDRVKDILTSMVTTEAYSCHSSTGYSLGDPLQFVDATCPPAYKLFSCTGGPGDQRETRAAYNISPNYNTNSCRLVTFVGACTKPVDEPWTRQKVVATCYPAP